MDESGRGTGFPTRALFCEAKCTGWKTHATKMQNFLAATDASSTVTTASISLAIFIIFVALVFDFINGPGWGLLLLFILLSPIIGFLLGAINMIVTAWVFRKATPRRVDRFFRRMQLASAAVYSLAHGGNDAQKTMGIIVMLLITAG